MFCGIFGFWKCCWFPSKSIIFRRNCRGICWNCGKLQIICGTQSEHVLQNILLFWEKAERSSKFSLYVSMSVCPGPLPPPDLRGLWIMSTGSAPDGSGYTAIWRCPEGTKLPTHASVLVTYKARGSTHTARPLKITLREYAAASKFCVLQ